MNTFLELASSTTVIVALGWTLIHFVWQAALISLIAWVARETLRGRSSHAQYLALCSGFSLMAIVPIVTFAVLLSNIDMDTASNSIDGRAAEVAELGSLGRFDEGDSRSESVDANSSTTSPLAPSPSSGIHGEDYWAGGQFAWGRFDLSRLSICLPVFVAFWSTGVLLLTIRLLLGFNGVQHWRREARQNVNSDLSDLFLRLKQSICIGPAVQLLHSTLIAVPMVIGWIRPVVLVPASLISHLTTEEFEAILAHELAHIRRYDYLVNLFQIVIETAMFYHPAVWWLSSQIRIEREHCCDDIAISVCGNRLVFAKALSRIEQLRNTPQRFVVAADGGTLVERIRRLTSRDPVVASRWPAGIMTLLALSVVFGYLWLPVATATHANTPRVTFTPFKLPVESKSDLDEYNTRKTEVKKIDSKTGVEKRVYRGIKLTSSNDGPAKSAELEMMYSNVMMYTFIPERIAIELGAVPLGEIDFGEKAPLREGAFQTGIEFSPAPAKQAQDPKPESAKPKPTTTVDKLNEPAGAVEIVPYPGDAIWVPGHLGFYGMNQTNQHKFKVVRIDVVDLGVGLPFKRLNVLVLNDENSEFGVLGRNAAALVRGKNDETLWWHADGTFQLMASPKKAQRLVDDDNFSKPHKNKTRPPIRRPGQLTVTSNQPDSKIDVNLVKPGINRIKTHNYSMASRASTGWVLVGGIRKPIDGGVEHDGIIVYVTLMGDVVAIDSKTKQVKWQIPWGKTQPIWRTVSVVELEQGGRKQFAIELFAAQNKTREITFRYVNLKTGEPIISRK